MQFRKISWLLNYTILILKKYNEIKQQQENNIYQIIEVKKDKESKFVLTVQIIGKASVFECFAHEIVSNENLLEGFSRKDVRAITYLACQIQAKPKYKILSKNVNDAFCDIIFTLQESDSNKLITKTAREIVVDEDIIKNLNFNDTKCVLYLAGYENSHISIN